MTHRPIRMTLLALALALTAGSCQQTNASPQARAREPAKQPAQQSAGQYKKLLAQMQAADAEPDAVRRCLDYPAPPGVTWKEEAIRVRCELLAPPPKFLYDGAATKDAASAAAIFDSGFAALMDEVQASLAAKDGRINRAIAMFSDGAALPYTDKWLQHSPRSPFAHAARGASLLAKASTTRGGAYSSQTEPADLDTAAEQAQAAADELRQAYELEPRLSAACALRTTALMLSGGSRAAIPQGRACAKAHPESYFAASAWGSAAEPRWGGSQNELDEVLRFLDANRDKNPLHGTVVGKIKAYDLLVARRLTRDDVKKAEQYASYGPSSYLLNVISAAWRDLGEHDLWMAYLSSAVRFDIDPGDSYRNMRAQFNIAARPDWALIDYRFLKEKYKGDPAIEGFLSQAEQNVRDGTGPAYARDGGVRYKGDDQYKATLMSECLSFGTSDRKLDPVMEHCSDRLVGEWPDDPGAWFIRARVQQHRGQPGWQEAARRYLAMADASSDDERRRIALVKELLKASGAPDSTGAGNVKGSPQASDGRSAPVRPYDPKTAALLSKMRAAEDISNPIQRCRDYPNPVGVQWNARMIEAYCDRFEPSPEFVRKGLVSLPSPQAIEQLESGFAALLADTSGDPARRDARLQAAFRAFDDPSLVSEQQDWTAQSWSDRKIFSPFAQTARGVSLLAKAESLWGSRKASEMPPADLSIARHLAKLAAGSFQRAYKTAPALSPACAWSTTALRLAAGGSEAIASGRKCAHEHPESHAALVAWKVASEPRWGGSREGLAEVAAFARQNLKSNLLHPAVIDSIDVDDVVLDDSPLSEPELKRLQSIAAMNPDPLLLARIADGWLGHGRRDLWLMYLSSAIRLDPDDRLQFRARRADGTLSSDPEWAVVDFRYLKDKRWGFPSLRAFLASAEYALAHRPGVAAARQASPALDPSLMSKARYMRDCEQLLASKDPRRYSELRPCANRLVARWPDDADCWFLRARLLHMVNDEYWRPSAERYLKLLVRKDTADALRAKLIEQLLANA